MLAKYLLISEALTAFEMKLLTTLATNWVSSPGSRRSSSCLGDLPLGRSNSKKTHK